MTSPLLSYPEIRFLAMHSVFPDSRCVFQCSQYGLQGTGGTVMKNIIQTGIRCGSVGGFIFQNGLYKESSPGSDSCEQSTWNRSPCVCGINRCFPGEKWRWAKVCISINSFSFVCPPFHCFLSFFFPLLSGQLTIKPLDKKAEVFKFFSSQLKVNKLVSVLFSSSRTGLAILSL